MAHFSVTLFDVAQAEEIAMHRLALRGSLVLVLVGCGESFSVDDAGDTGVELMDR